MVDQGVLEKLVVLVKRKRELSGLPDKVVLGVVNKVVSKSDFDFGNKRDLKLVVKESRASLRDYVGRFQNDFSVTKRLKLLGSGKKADFVKLLLSHSSTRERLNDYGFVKKLVFSFKPQSILDLGCGLNPLMLATPKTEYFAFDVNNNDLAVVKEFFRNEGVQGDVFLGDVRGVKSFPKVDVCLIFKVLDLLGKDKRSASKSLISRLRFKVLIASFPSVTLSGKPMRSPRRFWFEQVLKDLGFSFEIEKILNEIFYVVKK